MTNKNEKHLIQQDVSTKKPEIDYNLKSARLDFLRKIDLLSAEYDDIQEKILELEVMSDGIGLELTETYKFISEKILKQPEQPGQPEEPNVLNRPSEVAKDEDSFFDL